MKHKEEFKKYLECIILDLKKVPQKKGDYMKISKSIQQEIYNNI